MRSLKDFELLAAETGLLKAAATGATYKISDKRPSVRTPQNEVTAAFIRFLALGGDADAPVHESGVHLHGAYINGAIDLDGAGDVRPLWLENCLISSHLSLFDARTKVISLDGSFVKFISGDRVKIAGSLLLQNGFVCDGAIRLSGAEIDGTLACEGSIVRGEPWRWQRLSINLSTATVNGNVEFSRDFSADGLICLDDALIGGLFDCSGGRFNAGPVDKKPSEAEPWDRGVRALKCHRLKLHGSLYLRGCTCDGEISFSGAEIEGDLDCRRGTFRTTGDGEAMALRFSRADIGGNVYMSDGFDAFGKVQFNGATVRGNLDCHGGTFGIPAGVASFDLAAPTDEFSEDALSLTNAEVGGALILAAIKRNDGRAAIFNGSVDLKSADVRVLVDEPSAWPQNALRRGLGQLRDVIHLDGFTYERLGGNAPTEASIRKYWLRCQPNAHLGRDFKPQPFEQLIKVLREMGHPEQARRMAIEREGYLVRRRLGNWSNGPGGFVRAFGALLWFLTGGLLMSYGYRPFRVLLVMTVFAAGCGWYYRIAAEQGAFAPRDGQVFLHPDFDGCRPHRGGNWIKCRDIVGDKFAEYPRFNPWIYSFNVLLPVIELQQEKSWIAIHKEVVLDLPEERKVVVPEWGTKALILAEVVFGWLGSFLAVAGFSGLVKADW